MKYIKTYEFVKNQKLKVWIINQIIHKLSKYVNISRVKNTENEFGYFSFQVEGDNEKYNDLIRKIINAYNRKISKGDMHIYYDVGKHGYVSGQLKTPKLKRFSPKKYVYHVTDIKNVNSILEKGLTTDNSDWTRWSVDLAYPNAVFASADLKDLFMYDEYDDDNVILQIDTSSLSNKWWVDLNFYDPNLNTHYRPFIMTFEDIPAHAIEEYEAPEMPY
jgi:hypothetical protein